jgi:hypothetical protein
MMDTSLEKNVEYVRKECAKTFKKHPKNTGYGSLGPSEFSHETQLTAIPFAFKLTGTSLVNNEVLYRRIIISP